MMQVYIVSSVVDLSPSWGSSKILQCVAVQLNLYVKSVHMSCTSVLLTGKVDNVSSHHSLHPAGSLSPEQ